MGCTAFALGQAPSSQSSPQGVWECLTSHSLVCLIAPAWTYLGVTWEPGGPWRGHSHQCKCHYLSSPWEGGAFREDFIFR